MYVCMHMHGHKKMLLDGGLTLWWPNLHVPILKARGMLPQDFFCYFYALKSILVRSEIYWNHTDPYHLEQSRQLSVTGMCGLFHKHGGATAPPAPLLLTPVVCAPHIHVQTK